MQPRQARLDAVVFIDLDTHEVKTRQVHELPVAAVHVRDEPFGVRGPDRAADTLQQTHNVTAPVPAHAGGGNGAEGVGEHHRMTGARANVPTNDAVDRGDAVAAGTEPLDELVHWDADHDAQPVLVGAVEQPARGNRVHADRVDSDGGHGGEIPRDDRVVGTRVVDDAPDVELLVTGEEELRARAHPDVDRCDAAPPVIVLGRARPERSLGVRAHDCARSLHPPHLDFGLPRHSPTRSNRRPAGGDLEPLPTPPTHPSRAVRILAIP